VQTNSFNGTNLYDNNTTATQKPEYRLYLMHHVIVSKLSYNRGCFATDFDAQAHCIKSNAKTGVFAAALIENYIKVLVKTGAVTLKI